MLSLANHSEAAASSSSSNSVGLNGEDRLFFSAAAIHINDPTGKQLHGFVVGGGLWDEFSSDAGARVLYFVSNARGKEQVVTSGGVNLGGLMFRAGPFRAFPTVELGVTHRTISPAQGLETVSY